MKNIFLFFWGTAMLSCVIAGNFSAARGDAPAVTPQILQLWPDLPPSNAGAETVDKNGSVGNVSVPEISVYLPPKTIATGMAWIVCPGGSYRVVGEYQNAWWTVPRFVQKGIAIIALKYRTHPPSAQVEKDALADAKRAVRLVRSHAKEWNIDPSKIGMLGTSAGSHLIFNLATHWDKGTRDAIDPVERISCRPDFAVLLCPWPDKQTIDAFPINKETPPIFAASAVDDKVAPTAFAEAIVTACQKAGVPSLLWTVERGGHTAFNPGNSPGNQWPEHLWPWLVSIGMVK